MSQFSQPVAWGRRTKKQHRFRQEGRKLDRVDISAILVHRSEPDFIRSQLSGDFLSWNSVAARPIFSHTSFSLHPTLTQK